MLARHGSRIQVQTRRSIVVADQQQREIIHASNMSISVLILAALSTFLGRSDLSIIGANLQC